MLKRNMKKAVCMLVAAAMVVTSLQVTGTADAAKKKATLKTKKITVKVGKKATIKLKNKKSGAKYTFTVKNKKIATVSKKGVVLGKKAGSTKVTVKEKIKKKTRKVGVVAVKVKKAAAKKIVVPKKTTAPTKAPVVPTKAPTAAPTVAPTVEPTVEPTVAPTVAPTPKPINEKFVELIDKNDAHYDAAKGGLWYDNTDGSLWAEQYDDIVVFKLPADLEKGFSAMVFDLSVYDKDGNELEYSSVYSGPVNCSFSFKTADDSDIQDLWNYILNGVSVVDMSSDVTDADYTTGDKTMNMSIKDMEVAKVLIRSVRVSGYEGYDVPTENHEISGKLPEEDTPVDVTPFYDDMVTKSLMSTGNNARIKKAIEKAKNGEDVTIGYIGGSITEGQGASPNSKCYAEVSYNAFKTKYGKGDGSNVHFVNAGMSGTPSSLGVIRYQRDVIDQAYSTPDILFVEFSVNDGGECTGGTAYESIVRDAMESGAAVVLMFAVFKSKWNMQDTYKPLGENYDLPMISIKDAIVPYFSQGMNKWFFDDDLHPNNDGYQLMSDCISNMYDKIDAEEAETDTRAISDITPTFGANWCGVKMLDGNTTAANLPAEVTSFNVGDFTQNDGATGDFFYKDKDGKTRAKFAKNWEHVSGTNSFKMTVNCSNMMFVYKVSSSTSFGKADIYVDGVKKTSADGYLSSGWNNPETKLLITGDEVKSHEIEVRMAEGNEDKSFTILGFGYSTVAK